MTAGVSHRRGEHVRQTVLAAAIEELAAHGFDGATVAAVAQRSGVHETTVYRRWATRENLFVAALLERSADAMPAPDTGSIKGDLLAIVREVLAYVGSPAGTAILRAATLPVDHAYADAPAWLQAPGLKIPQPNLLLTALGLQAAEMRGSADLLAEEQKRVARMVALAPANVCPAVSLYCFLLSCLDCQYHIGSHSESALR